MVRFGALEGLLDTFGEEPDLDFDLFIELLLIAEDPFLKTPPILERIEPPLFFLFREEGSTLF